MASEAKLAMNYTAVTIIDLMGQVYAFGEKTGIPLASLHMMFRMLWAQPVMQGYATRIWKCEFNDVGFDVRGGLKDVNLMLDAAHKAHVRWDFAESIQPKMTRAIEWAWIPTIGVLCTKSRAQMLVLSSNEGASLRGVQGCIRP